MTMCAGYGCPAKLQCHRAMTRPSMLQSWFASDPRQADGTCSQYWGNPAFAPKKNRNRKSGRTK
jgi:hypothetical protein